MAEQRLWIASPYFVPDEGIVHALQLAAIRGVDVRILLPMKPDQWLVWLASFAILTELEHPNLHILERDFAASSKVDARDYDRRPLHFKAAARAARLLAPIL